MSVQVSYKKQTLLGIFGLLILFVVVEGIANVWWITQITCEFEENEIFMNMDEEKRRQLCLDLYEVKTLGNELIPNQQSNSITINSLGFRGDEFSQEKPDDVYRIFMLGGSTMFGHGATSDQTTIPGYMQNFFQNNEDEFKPQIINGGIQGADSYAELELIETKLVSYLPNMVIVYDGWNDLRAENSAESIHTNWKKICELGKQNNFDVIIALQPIAGFGNKILTEQELKYSKFGTNYNEIPLINSISEYDNYTSNLDDLENCTSSINLRTIFDNETSPIYWDQGHVSDSGNSIVAKALYNEILEFISKNPVTRTSSTYDIVTTNNDKIFENQIRYLLSNYKTSMMFSSIFSFEIIEEKALPVLENTSTDKFDEQLFRTSSKIYNDTEVYITVKVLENENTLQKTLEIKTIDNNDNSTISNVTYFLKIQNNDTIILNDFFFAENNILILDVIPDNSNLIEISGERQYDHNAIISTETPGIIISGPLLLPNENYEFIFEIRTLYDKSNWIFSLDDLRVKIQS